MQWSWFGRMELTSTLNMAKLGVLLVATLSVEAFGVNSFPGYPCVLDLLKWSYHVSQSLENSEHEGNSTSVYICTYHVSICTYLCAYILLYICISLRCILKFTCIESNSPGGCNSFVTSPDVTNWSWRAFTQLVSSMRQTNKQTFFAIKTDLTFSRCQWCQISNKNIKKLEQDMRLWIVQRYLNTWIQIGPLLLVFNIISR